MFEGNSKLLIQNWNGFYYPSSGCEQASSRAKGKLQIMSTIILNKIMRIIAEKLEPIWVRYNTTENHVLWLFNFVLLNHLQAYRKWKRSERKAGTIFFNGEKKAVNISFSFALRIKHISLKSSGWNNFKLLSFKSRKT